jgi:hypothetical protein
MLSLLQLAEDEAGAVTLLTAFAREHPGVTVLTPHYADEPWRAEVREGKVPGESGTTSAVLTANQPTELLRKLEKLFPDGDAEDDSG